MFRLVFLAFHGERAPSTLRVPHDVPRSMHGAAQHLAPSTHARARICTMRRRRWRLRSSCLRSGRSLAGYIGLPHALGGSNRLEQFLAPSLDGCTRPKRGHAAANEGLELALMGVSTLVAAAGIGLAVFFFLRNRAAADQLARALRRRRTACSRTSTTSTRSTTPRSCSRSRSCREEGLWKRLDVRVIDGAVNGVAETVGGMSELLRRLQTGSVRAYAASVFVGVVLYPRLLTCSDEPSG